MERQKLIQQGAEAKILLKETMCRGILVSYIIKERASKNYRHPELDKKIIKSRTKKEAKLLEKVSKIIPCPLPTKISLNAIEMPFIKGKKLSEHLENLDWKSICKIIGNQIAKLHDNDIIHGDLTTSNMIWVSNQMRQEKIHQHLNHLSQDSLHIAKDKKEVAELVQASCRDNSPKLYFIDFGLGFTSSRIEDKAVDLHLIKQALEAKHFTVHKESEKIIFENYNSEDREKILNQLKKVEARGRYKGVC